MLPSSSATLRCVVEPTRSMLAAGRGRSAPRAAMPGATVPVGAVGPISAARVAAYSSESRPATGLVTNDGSPM